MKIAIPTDSIGGLSDIVFNHFGMAPTYTVIEIIENKIGNVEIIDNTSETTLVARKAQLIYF